MNTIKEYAKKYIDMLNLTHKAFGNKQFKILNEVKDYRKAVTKVIGATEDIKKGQKLNTIL